MLLERRSPRRGGSEFVDSKSGPISVIPALIVTPVKSGVHPLNLDTFSNGMTDAVRHLDAGMCRHDELLSAEETVAQIVISSQGEKSFLRTWLKMQDLSLRST
jgi:hypothetical protein